MKKMGKMIAGIVTLICCTQVVKADTGLYCPFEDTSTGRYNCQEVYEHELNGLAIKTGCPDVLPRDTKYKYRRSTLATVKSTYEECTNTYFDSVFCYSNSEDCTRTFVLKSATSCPTGYTSQAYPGTSEGRTACQEAKQAETPTEGCQKGADCNKCLYVVKDSDGNYTNHDCSKQAGDDGTCPESAGWFSSYTAYRSEPYDNTSQCEATFAVLQGDNKAEQGYCYQSKATECTQTERFDCNNKGGTFYYDASNSEKAKTECEKANLDKDVYCYDASQNKCVLLGTYAKYTTPAVCYGSGQVFKGGTGEENKQKCEDYIKTQDSKQWCSYATRFCNGGMCTDGQRECLEAKDGKCESSQYNAGKMTTYTNPKGPMSHAECLKETATQCCMYESSGGSHSCLCGSEYVTTSRTCQEKSGYKLYSSTVYNSYGDCEKARPSEAIGTSFNLPGEGLTKETLEKLNPLRNSINEFGTPANRTPGMIVSKLVKSIVFPIAGLLLFLQIVWAGFQIVQGGAFGDDNTVSNGKQRLTATIIGFILLFASYWLWSLVELALGLNAT